jgi:25S rRNA (uracil2634-N3)-methyltransferase
MQKDKGQSTKKPPHGQSSASKPAKKHRQQHPDEPVIPFGPNDRILLVGEGDLSFAASIIEHLGCTNVTATVLEKDHAELLAKYPAVDTNIAVVNRRPDADAPPKSPSRGAGSDAGEDGQSDVEAAEDDDADYDSVDSEGEKKQKPIVVVNNKLIYNVDATKLPSSIARAPHDRIIFNFPHVGGKSTDVNRQVRYNQELLVSFFQRALSSSTAPLAPGGSIIVTLFESEPYTLWNIKDLGRHAGLQLERSFRFKADVYPGYHHARTFGVVKNKKGEEGKGWKGEDRPARSYVFMRKEEIQDQTAKKRKRSGDDSSSDDDDED